MKKKAVLAAAAIVLLGGAAILAILLAPAGDGRVSLSAPSLPEATPPPPGGLLPPLPPTSPGPGAPFGVAPSPPQLYEPPPPRPPPGSWEGVAVAARPAALGAVGVAVSTELGELQPRLAECFDEVTQSRYGQVAFSRTASFQPSDGSATPLLMIQLETGAGQVRIVDAPVDAQGSAPDGLIACAQQVLRGRTIPAPGVQAGQRARLVVPLIP